MSAFATLNITRSRAKQFILLNLLGDLPDDKLEQLMDSYLEVRLYNCRIVADGDDYNNDDVLD